MDPVPTPPTEPAHAAERAAPFGVARFDASVRTVTTAMLVVLAYVAAAAAGFRLAFLAEQVTTVWAPTGIALATLMVGGLRWWPAIMAGALFANALSNAPLWTAVIIAGGNTLEAVAAVWWLRRVQQAYLTFRRVEGVLAFLIIAAALCTAISATVGVMTLCVAGVQPWSRFFALWFDWWLGDAVGAAIVTPVLVTVLRHTWSRRHAIEALLWVAGTLVVTHLVFGRFLGFSAHPLEYVVFPLIIGAALTGGPAVSSGVVLSASIVTIWDTVHGAGPFAGGEVHRSLVLLQVFTGILAATSLVLAAAIEERRVTQERERDAAEELRDREELLRLAQRAGGVATFEWDFRNQIAQCSGEFFHLLGMPAYDGLITATAWFQYLHPDDRERMAAHLSRVLEGTEAAAADYRIVAMDGTVRWLTYAGQIEMTAEGERMFGSVVDITERKSLEAEFRRHASEVERILESIGEGFVALDREFRYVYVNAPAEQMLGQRRAQLIGRVLWDVFPEGVIGETRRQLEAAAASGAPMQFDLHIAEWNRRFESRVYPSPAGLSIFFSDATARVASEAALRESRDVLALAMRGGSMGAWSRNLMTNEVWWSRELEELFGLQPGEFTRTDAGFFVFVHEEDRSAVRQAIDDAIRERTDYQIEFRFRHASGEWRWLEGRGRAVYADDGVPRTLYGIGIDVTARKRTEIALRDAKIAAESANQLKDQFLATVSHELRTPLNAILGYARLLQSHGIPADKRERAIDVIERNAVAQNQLIEDLLDMSRITSGTIRLDPVRVPVVTVLRETLEGIKPAADAKRIAMEVEFDPFAGTVRADTTRLQQVFWNLLSNAVKFTGEEGAIVVALRRAGTQVEIIVSDNGTGISPEFLPFVFEPFRQGENRFDRARGGLGLGLAITRQLVELHGGTIEVSSRGIGHGSTFVVRLPCVPGPDAVRDGTDRRLAEARPQAEQPPSLSGLRILLVEDEEDTLSLFREALEQAGADVRAVGNGPAALRESDAWEPDLLVTDLGLPGMDGYELLRTMRSKRSPGRCPAVAVSAYARSEDRTRAFAAGFQAHVAKPVDPAALVLALRNALSDE